MASTSQGLKPDANAVERQSSWMSLSPYNYLLNLSPLRSFLASWGVGVALVALSFLLGIGRFHASILIVASGQSTTREVGLGYAEQWNYGPWFTVPILCPAVFALCSIIFRASAKLTPSEATNWCNLRIVSRKPIVAMLGLVILGGFLWKNVWVELDDMKHLGLGWVQSESLEREGLLVQGGKPPIEIKRDFRSFNVDGQQVQADRVLLKALTPADFHVKNHIAFMCFVLVAKLWAGFWEGLVVYVSLLLCFWSFGVYRTARIAGEGGGNASQGLSAFGIGWTQQIVISVLILGLEVNVFSILRFLSNVFKGSFGKWDQYWSFLVLSPTIILAVLAIAVVLKGLNESYIDLDSMVSKFEITLWSTWMTSYAFLVHLLLGFNDGPTNAVLASVIQFVTKPKT